ncbi:MAG TPA: DUF2062 domain-containing protein [Terracidiphilus sp.]
MHSSVPTWDTVRLRSSLWLRQGIAPRRLALTLVLGFVIGCIPLVGLPTALCAVVALAFRLNQPAIQAANYAAMPFQLVLVVPLVRLGAKLTPHLAHPGLDLSALTRSPARMFAHPPQQLVMQLGGMAGQALLAWFLVAIPVVMLLTPTLTLLLRRVPALAESKSSN